MNRNVIYFPYIQVPKSEWFTRVLLYWDQVCSIVPMEYFDDAPSSFGGEYMNDLVEEGLVRAIHPSSYVWDIPNFRDAFLNYVDDPKYPVPKDINDRKRLPTFKIHMEKLAFDIGEKLVDRGLARPIQETWVDVESYTANQFMSYLAHALGKCTKSEPITDQIQYLNSFAPEFHEDRKLSNKIDEMRTVILEDILPAPSGDINPKAIADFKNDYGRELKRFRNEIESFLLIAAAEKDLSLRKRKINQFIIESHDKVEELSEHMKSKGWRIKLSKFLGYSATAFGLAAVVTTGNLPGALAAAFGLGKSTIDIANKPKNKDILQENYTAYAVLAGRHL